MQLEWHTDFFGKVGLINNKSRTSYIIEHAGYPVTW